MSPVATSCMPDEPGGPESSVTQTLPHMPRPRRRKLRWQLQAAPKAGAAGGERAWRGLHRGPSKTVIGNCHHTSRLTFLARAMQATLACLGLVTLSLLLTSSFVWASESHETSPVRISIKCPLSIGAIAKSCSLALYSTRSQPLASQRVEKQRSAVSDPCALALCTVVRMPLGLCLGIGPWNGDADLGFVPSPGQYVACDRGRYSQVGDGLGHADVLPCKDCPPERPFSSLGAKVALSSGPGVARDSVCRTRDDALREMEKATKVSYDVAKAAPYGEVACRSPSKPFPDTAGLEGHHSCLLFGNEFVLWVEARDICHGRGEELLTFQVGIVHASRTLLSPPLITALPTPSCVLAEPL